MPRPRRPPVTSRKGRFCSCFCRTIIVGRAAADLLERRGLSGADKRTRTTQALRYEFAWGDDDAWFGQVGRRKRVFPPKAKLALPIGRSWSKIDLIGRVARSSTPRPRSICG
jgi:hypothetical protein